VRIRVLPVTNVRGYRLEEEIGAGGMGVVYRATRIADGTSVAVKVLRGQVVTGDEEYLRRLRTEAGLAGSVEHHGVVRVHEVGDEGDIAWLAMDLVSGPDLQRLLDDRGPLSPERAAELLAQVADAVAAVHAAGLVHRDLKPANILLEGERPLVADFGVARPTATVESTLGIGLTGSTDWARTGTGPESAALPGTGAGTVAYMAPEQWRGEQGDARTDVYALGGTLYAALTGRRPFQHRALPELAYAVAMIPPPAPSADGAPTAFDAVVATAMAKDPDKRYPDATMFAAAVRAAAAGRPLPDVAATGNLAAAPSSVPQRRRRLLTIAAATTTLLSIGVGLTVWRPWLTEPTTVEKTVCAWDMTVRNAARSKAVIATLRRDDRIQVHTEMADHGWAQVDLPDGRRGWVLAEYLGPPC
jgi:serine/threonine protein kinase